MKTHLRRYGLYPLLAAALMVTACFPMGGFPVGNPRSAHAGERPMSPEEAAARASQHIAEQAHDLAGIADLVPIPGVREAGTVVERASLGYLIEINRQLSALDAQGGGQPSDYTWAVLFALGAGVMNIFAAQRGVKIGRELPRGGT